MNMRHPWSALGCLGLLLVASVAQATVGPPVRIRLASEPQLVKAGDAVHDVLTFEALDDIEILDVQIGGEGWGIVSLQKSVPISLKRGQVSEIAFDALPTDPSRFLRVRVNVDGRWHAQSFDFSERTFLRSVGPLPTRSGPDFPVPAIEVEGPQVQPHPDLEEKIDLQAAMALPSGVVDETSRPKAARTIHVRGRFAYMRDDLVMIGADAVYVRVMEMDGPFRHTLATGVTDPYGDFNLSFEWDPCGICESQPDINIRFSLATSVATIQDTHNNDYEWELGTWENYTGTDLNIGTQLPFDEDDDPAVHFYTNIVRAWRWFGVYGYDPPHIEGFWPDGVDDGAWYINDEIHVSEDRNWGEGTHSHEYGHHWKHHYTATVSPDYCNWICDDDVPTGDCGHCRWCQENEYDAWEEGFSDWIGYTIPNSNLAVYGIEAAHGYGFESLGTCTELGGVLDDPYITEGFAAALLRDIEDPNDDNHAEYPLGEDRLNMGCGQILDLVDDTHPMQTSIFILDFKNRHTAYQEKIWDVAKHCGFNMDGNGPGVASDFRSTSHEAGASEFSPDNTIDLAWTHAPDEFSGIEGYAVKIANSPQLPLPIRNTGDVTTHTTGAVDPGTWYISLRAVDRAGNWSPNYVWAGPFYVRDPEDADLEAATIAGWPYPTIPLGSDIATVGLVPLPSSLPGDQLSTYWNVRGKNSGESSTGTFENWLFADGTWVWWEWFPMCPPLAGFQGVNLGPIMLTGGRHTFESCYDGSERVAESDETNNHWARQWIWDPVVIALDTPKSRNSPRNSTGGWEYLSGTKWYNCDGVRLEAPSGSPWWHAMVIRPTDLADDYDCRLHEPSTGAADGFTANAGHSARGTGMLDAVLVNRNISGNSHDWDVGVLDHGDDGSIYRVAHRGSEEHDFGDSLTVAMDSGEMLLMREFYLSSDDVGAVSIWVEVDPADGPIIVTWFDESFSTGDLLDYEKLGRTDPFTGKARLDINTGAVGYHCAVVYRDPAAGTDAIDVTIEIGPSPPDFMPYWATGWHAPLVPRPSDDGTPTSVPAPPTLVGNAASTYLNVAVRNDGPGRGSGLVNHVCLDGAPTWSLSYPDFPIGAWSLFNSPSPWFVRGGRHVVSMRLDPAAVVDEALETNNIHGAQWIWSPYLLDFTGPVTRTIPPSRTGGWEDLSGVVLWFNCDGFRTEEFQTETGYFNAVAVMPGAESDVDVRLHEIVTGVTDGFESNLVRSSQGVGAADYVVVNNNITPFREFDAGVLRISGTEDYTIESMPSNYLGVDPIGLHGPFTMTQGKILNLHEMRLTPGSYTFTITDRAAFPTHEVEWGATFHPADDPFLRRSDAYPGGDVWTVSPFGNVRWATVEITDTDYYCLAVYKPRASDLGRKAKYELRISNELTGVDDPTPIITRTGMNGIYPNPFNPRTTISFDLAEAGPVEIEIYDLRGHRIRTLLKEGLAVGRYEHTWDGTDDRGRRVSSGTYFARLTTVSGSDQRKMVLLK